MTSELARAPMPVVISFRVTVEVMSIGRTFEEVIQKTLRMVDES